MGAGEVTATAPISREMIHVASSFSVVRLHQSAVPPSVSRCTNHHRHRSRLRQGSEWDSCRRCRSAGAAGGDRHRAKHDRARRRFIHPSRPDARQLRVVGSQDWIHSTTPSGDRADRRDATRGLYDPGRCGRAPGSHGPGGARRGAPNVGSRDKRNSATDPTAPDPESELPGSRGACARRRCLRGSRQLNRVPYLFRRRQHRKPGERVRRRDESQKRPHRRWSGGSGCESRQSVPA